MWARVPRDAPTRLAARSTLSAAWNLRDWRIYHALAMRRISPARSLHASWLLDLDLDATVHALDATPIDLCLSLFDWAPLRNTKAAVRLHTLLDLRGTIPAFTHISDGKRHLVNILEFLPSKPGAFCIMDRGYLDFARLHRLHQAGALFITRNQTNKNVRRVYWVPTECDAGLIYDQTIALNCFHAAQDYPEHLRCIRFKDPVSGETLIFLTNNTTLPPLTIAALYKNR